MSVSAWTGHQSRKSSSARLSSSQELLGCILSLSTFTFAAASELHQESRDGVWAQFGPDREQRNPWGDCEQPWSCPALAQMLLLLQTELWDHPNVLFFFPVGRRMEENSIPQHMRVSISFLLLPQLLSSCFALPSQMQQGPRFQLLRWKYA